MMMQESVTASAFNFEGKNRGFNNMLLITPPKVSFFEESQSSNDNKNSNQKDEDLFEIYKQLVQEDDGEGSQKLNLEKIMQIDQRIPKNSDYNYFKKIAPFNVKTIVWV